MGRMAAKFFAREIGTSPAWVYDIWNKMGLVIRDGFGGWALTDLGRELGGRMSKSNYCPVPTFVFEVIEPKMREFFLKHRQ